MTSTDLKRDMMQHVNGASFISLTQLAAFLGYSKNSMKEVRSKYVAGLDRIGSGYYIPDVVKRVMSEAQE